MGKILGLDLGTSSIGWALVDIKEEIVEGKKILEDFELIDGGVRLFKEMVDNKGNALNAERRASRSLRKVIKRKKNRLIRVIYILRQLGFIEETKTINTQLNTLLSVSPYFLRKKALDEQLKPNELIKVLLHLAKRRGFRSSAKDQDKKNKDREKLKIEIEDAAKKNNISLEDYAVFLVEENKENSIMKGIVLLEMLFEKSDYRTLGEFFYEVYQNTSIPKRIRGRFLDRGLLEQEFNKILEKQSEFYPILKEKKYNQKYQSFWKDLRNINTNTDLLYDTIFEPRPLKSQKNLIGKCPFFVQEKRAVKSSLLFQEYSLWAKINTIKIIQYDTDNKTIDRNCTEEEKNKIFSIAKEKKEIKWKDIRKILNLEEKEKINFELKNGSQNEKFNGLISYIVLKEYLNQHFDLISEEDKEKIIYSFSDGEVNFYKMVNTISNKYSLSQEEKEELKKIEFPYSTDYASYSSKLLNILLPYIKNGITLENNQISYKEYDILEYLKDKNIIPKSKELKGRLLKDQEISQITFNPRVKKMLFELRKILKALINKYGEEEVKKNWIFKIELARQMKKDEYGKTNQTQNQTFYQQLREEARNNGMKNKEDENRYILWLSQEKHCVYCQKVLSLSNLNGMDTEIDHIIPISRIPDDSMENKVLCCQACNQTKGNKTPLEAFGNTPNWEKMIDILRSIILKKTKAYQEAKNSSKNPQTIPDIPKEKKVLMNYSKFLRIQWTQENIEEQRGKFSSRQLNETSFGSKEVIKFIEHLRGVEELSIPKDRKILTTKGNFTNRIKGILNINTDKEIFTEDELGQQTPKSLLAVEIVSKAEKKEEKGEKEKNKKQRDDHRHHFLDAFALTFIGPSFENRVSNIEQYKNQIKYFLLEIANTKLNKKELETTINSFIQCIEDIEKKQNSDPEKRKLGEELIQKISHFIKNHSISEKQQTYFDKQIKILVKPIFKHNTSLSSHYEKIIHKIQEEIPKKLDSMIISHAHNRKIKGKLHEETVYGVLNTLPVNYLNKERINKLRQNKYISQELEKAIWAYIDEHKFLPIENGQTRKKEATDIVLYSFRRGKNKIQDKYGILPPPIELNIFWNEAQHGPYKRDKIPLLKPLYTKRAEPTIKNIQDLADVRDQKNILEKVTIKDKIEEEYKNLINRDKKKKKDFTREELVICPTIIDEIEKLDRKKQAVENAFLIVENKGIYDDLITIVRNLYQFKKVLLLDFASKKFIPESKTDAHKAFKTGSNHHMAVFERTKKDKKGNIQYKQDGITPEIERKGIVITMVDVAHRARRKNKPANEKDKVIYQHYENYEEQYKILDNPEEWKFIFSLVAGDYIELEDQLYYKVYKMSQGTIHCSFITTSGKYDGLKTPIYMFGKDKKQVKSVEKGENPLLSRIINKYSISPLGELIKVND